MAIVVGVALGLILGGLLMAWLSGSAKYPLLVQLLFFVGVALVVVGLVLLLTPVIVWVNRQLHEMLNLGMAHAMTLLL